MATANLPRFVFLPNLGNWLSQASTVQNQQSRNQKSSSELSKPSSSNEESNLGATNTSEVMSGHNVCPRARGLSNADMRFHTLLVKHLVSPCAQRRSPQQSSIDTLPH